MQATLADLLRPESFDWAEDVEDAMESTPNAATTSLDYLTLSTGITKDFTNTTSNKRRLDQKTLKQRRVICRCLTSRTWIRPNSSCSLTQCTPGEIRQSVRTQKYTTSTGLGVQSPSVAQHIQPSPWHSCKSRHEWDWVQMPTASIQSSIGQFNILIQFSCC